MGIVAHARAETASHTQQAIDFGSAIPTTSNPTSTRSKAGRIISNPSFERPTSATVSMICEASLQGWYTTHANRNDPNIGTAPCPVFEVWRSPFVDNLTGRTAPDGVQVIELGAYMETMAYQPICIVGGESFDFQFHHFTRPAPGTNNNTIAFRFGIPSLTSSSKAADSAANSLEVIQVQNTWNSASTPPTVIELRKDANTTNVNITVLPSY